METTKNFEIAIGKIKMKASLEYLSKSDILAKITSPKELEGIKVFGLHIPYFSMDRKDWYCKDDKITEKGIRVMEDELKRAYEVDNIFRNNLPEIHLKFTQIQLASYIAYLKEDFLNCEVFKSKKKALKSRMKKGEFSNIECQKKLKILKKKNEIFHHLEFGIEDGLRKYLDERHGVFLGVGVLPQYIEKFLVQT